MALSRQQKLLIIILVLYWPSLFIIAHVPIPQLIRESGVSDKSLHFLAYMILIFLLWSAINPYKKANWRKASVWLILTVIIWYGVVDEWLQGCVSGRSADMRDFLADVTGTLAGLLILSTISFWPASLIVTGITIFALTNLTGANWINILPTTNMAFNIFAYAFFTVLWIQYVQYITFLRAPTTKWLIVTLPPPMVFLLAVKVGSLIVNKDVVIWDVILSVLGIMAVVCAAFLMSLLRQKLTSTREMIVGRS